MQVVHIMVDVGKGHWRYQDGGVFAFKLEDFAAASWFWFGVCQEDS